MMMKEMFQLDEMTAAVSHHPLYVLMLKTQHCGVCEAVQAKVAVMLDKNESVSGGYAYLEKVPEAASVYIALTSPVVLVFFEGKEVYRAARFVRMDELEQVLIRYEEVLGMES
ncbi:thioredoxin [Paenibacillus lemnae]|uniref:Thioredoxin n=1 Tax=Paenibacillus lemnae TaxID=1330551 RepID=A0A848M2E2_PAELE|nr:thioredoxin [Paenibacillus lemnae]NMO95158.1 thioredoxin [Paenibacillus lemnae]